MFRKSEEKNSELQENLEIVNQENLNLHQKLETSLKETLALVEEKAALLTGKFSQITFLFTIFVHFFIFEMFLILF